jgi:ubiquinone/menaquinone biosynthesis C-methylase UbiE
MRNKQYKRKDKSQILFDKIASIYYKVGSEDINDIKNPHREYIWSKVGNEHILEVGVGTGNNIRYYPSQANITAIDYSEKMMAYAKKQAQEQNRNIDFHFMDVQSLDFEDNTFDQAVVTYVFCSVPDPILGLQELSRVVKSGGDIFFLEHGRINRPIIGKLMDFLNPIIAFFSGENINRQIDNYIKEVGLEISELKSYDDGLIKIVQIVNQKL